MLKVALALTTQPAAVTLAQMSPVELFVQIRMPHDLKAMELLRRWTSWMHVWSNSATMRWTCRRNVMSCALISSSQIICWKIWMNRNATKSFATKNMSIHIFPLSNWTYAIPLRKTRCDNNHGRSGYGTSTLSTVFVALPKQQLLHSWIALKIYILYLYIYQLFINLIYFINVIIFNSLQFL